MSPLYLRSNNQPIVFMRKLLFLSLLSVTLFACKSKTDNGPLLLETREIDCKNLTGDEIQTQHIGLEVPGVTNIAIHDSLLICVTSDPQGMVKVFNKHTLQPIASFCPKGRAANEFQGMIFNYNMQQYLRNGDLILPLFDTSARTQKELNVSASLREGHTIIEGTMKRPEHSETILLGNSLERAFTFYEPWEDQLRSPGVLPMPVYAVTENGQIIKEIPVFKEHLKSESTLRVPAYYRGMMIKHPDRNLVVLPLSGMDYILFFDLDNDRNYAVHQKGSPTAASIYIYDDYNKNENGGIGGPMHIPGTDMFMCICSSGEYTKQAWKEDRLGVELMFFDYEGNYKGGVKVNNNPQASAYDPETKTLYCSNIGDEQIFTIDLSEIEF